MDIWQRLEQEPDSPEVYEAALQRLFSEGQLYRALADAALPLERLRCALSLLKDYLRYYGGSVDPYRTFACHCPLCRGTHGEHHLRVLELAESVAWAWRFSVVNDLPVEARLHQAEEHLYRAVQRLCPDAAPIRAVSWSSEHPLRDLLHQYAARYPDPALNLIDELLHYFQHRQWRGVERRLQVSFPLAFQNGGALAKLALGRTDAPLPGIYPHPELLLATRWDEAFAEQFACAWQHHAPDKTAALRWELEPYRSEGRVWDGVPISGPSVGAAVGVALKCLHALDLPPPDIDCALTGKLEPDGTLGSVGGYLQKTLPFDRYRALCLIVPSGDYALAQSRLPDWGSRLRPAEDIDHALQQATHLPAAVQQYLQRLIEQLDTTPWYCNGQKLTNQRLFTPLRVLVAKPRQLDPDTDEEGGNTQDAPKRGGTNAPKERFTNLHAELQAALYELTCEYAQKEELRWDSFVQRVQREKRAALIGAPGSGKTFGTRHLVLTLAQQALQQLQQGTALDQIQAPFWLPARVLSESADLARAVAQSLPDAPSEWLLHALESGRFLLVIDALDELPESQRERFKRCVQALDATAGIVLVTCRTMHWEERSRWLGWRTLPDAAELAPLNPREQQAIAKQFFDAGAPEAQAMQRLLRESFVLRHACRTPLLLTFACLLQSENLLRSELTYAQLYAHILRRLIRGTWRNTAEPLASSEVGEERVLRQLETLAWNLFRQSPERNLFTLDAWVSAGSNAPSAPLDPAELLEKLERVGVVVFAGYDARGDSQWSFAHRSILEFLAARYLSRQPNWIDEISQHFWFQPEWVEVLTFLAGLVDNADPLVERLEQEADDIFGSMLYLQARVVGFGRVSDAIAQRVAERAVERYLRARIPEKYTLPVLRALGRHAVPHLAQALQDEDWRVRRAACKALGEIGDAQAVPHLAQALQDWDRGVCEEACKALGEIGDAQAVPHLAQVLQDWDRGVREEACKALGAIGDAQAIPHLIQALQDREWWVCHAACEALGEIGDPQATPYLIQALQDEDSMVRRMACEALGEIGDPQATPHLAQVLQDWDRGVREEACEALGEIGDPQAIPYLVQVLKDNDRSVRIAACRALAATGDSQVVSHLAQVLRSWDSELRRVACEALGRVGSLQAALHLINAFNDGDWKVRKAAAEAVRTMHYPEVTTKLLELLQSPDWRVRATACWALGGTESSNVISRLTHALRDPEVRVRKIACRALGLVSCPQAVPHLAELLEDEEAGVRKEACEALGKVGDPQAVPYLCRAKRDEDPTVRWAALYALGHIRDPQTLPYLIRALQKNIARVTMCRALGEIGDMQAVPHLAQIATARGEVAVRVAACEALGQICSLQAVPHLIQVLKDPWVRRTAFRLPIDIRYFHLHEAARNLCESAWGALWQISIRHKVPIRAALSE
jgi:HEAT repeat protein